jgi:putative transposase
MEGATQGVRTICIDEKSGIQALERAQDSPMKPGQAERKEFEYLRHGTQTLIANFDVATGKIIKPTIGMHRKEDDFLRHCQQLVASDPNAEKWCIVLDGLNIHKSESLVRWVAEMEGISDEELGTKGQTGILKSMKSRVKFLSNRSHRIVFYYTPKHCSWLNQVEIWFSILSRRLLRRASFSSIGNLAERIMRFIAQYNLAAKPFKWTFKGKLLHT